jgi:3-deoxy-D-manno-octulosonic-acid transferase
VRLKAAILYRLYSLLYTLLLPAFMIRLFWRSIRSAGYRKHFKQRFGFICSTPGASIWLHAVSVGETMAARTLVPWLMQQYPNDTIIITNTTPTGAAVVRQQWSNQVQQAFLPFDLKSFLRRFVKRCQPRLCIIMETEIWPNLSLVCRQHHIPLILANARLSERSKNNYQKIQTMTSAMLECFSLVATQTSADAKRFLALGLLESKMAVTGNVKFDCAQARVNQASSQHLTMQWQASGRPIWIAASTHEGEEAIIIEAFKQVLSQYSNVLLVLVPRHPERACEVVTLCQEADLKSVLRSEQSALDASNQVLIGDTLGELAQFFAASDIAFIGGSLVDVGGHNMLEPALSAVPVLTGPHVHNFSQVSQLLLEAGAAFKVKNVNELAARVCQLLDDEPLRKKMGQAACAVVMSNRGASDKLFSCIAGISSQ